jgi:hypothetical protein
VEDLSFSDVKIDFDFDASAPEAQEPNKKRTAAEAIGIPAGLRITTKAKRRKTYDLSRVPNAIKLIQELPQPGETVHAILGGDFHAWDLIPAAQEMIGKPISELTITTLGFNLANNQHLCEMIDAGKVQKVFVLCSAYFEGADRDVFNQAKERLEARGQKIQATRNHSKIILIKPASGPDRFVIESSANLRSCNNLEQMALTNDAALFEFHQGWILPLFQ